VGQIAIGFRRGHLPKSALRTLSKFGGYAGRYRPDLGRSLSAQSRYLYSLQHLLDLSCCHRIKRWKPLEKLLVGPLIEQLARSRRKQNIEDFFYRVPKIP
jgi:hypothetical protein